MSATTSFIHSDAGTTPAVSASGHTGSLFTKVPKQYLRHVYETLGRVYFLVCAASSAQSHLTKLQLRMCPSNLSVLSHELATTHLLSQQLIFGAHIMAVATSSRFVSSIL